MLQIDLIGLKLLARTPGGAGSRKLLAARPDVAVVSLLSALRQRPR